MGKLLLAAVGAAAGVAGVLAARGRRAAATNAELWSQATRSLAERDLDPPSTVSVNNGRRPHN